MYNHSLSTSAILRLALAAILFLCLAEMPYAYYQMVRLICTLGFGFLAYDSFRRQDKYKPFVYVLLILLFQPFEKIALGRELWNIADGMIGLWLLFTVYQDYKNNLNQ
jgi:hypothetical protein